ncbi:hypothetical protein BH23GEM2_BH23GEM2_15500 [soil metagenome]
MALRTGLATGVPFRKMNENKTRRSLWWSRVKRVADEATRFERDSRE